MICFTVASFKSVDGVEDTYLKEDREFKLYDSLMCREFNSNPASILLIEFITKILALENSHS